MYQDNVFRFYVTMQYLVTMQQLNCFQQIPYYKGRGLFGKSLTTTDDIKQLTITTQLHHYIELISFLEITIDVDYVGML